MKRNSSINQDFAIGGSNNGSNLRGFKSQLNHQMKFINDIYNFSRKKDIKANKISSQEQQKRMKRQIKDLNNYYKLNNRHLNNSNRKFHETFFRNRRQDLNNLERESENRFRNIEEQGTEAFSSMEEKVDSITEKMRDWKVAMDVDSMAKGLDNSVNSVFESQKQLQKLTGHQIEDLKGLSDKFREDSKGTGNKISAAEYMNSATSLAGMGYKDLDFLEKMGNVNAEISHVTGIDTNDMKGLSEFANTIGNPEMARQYGNLAKSLSSNEALKTNSSDVMKVFEEQFETISSRANGDVNKFDTLMKEQFKLKAFMDTNNVGDSSEALNELIGKIHGGDQETMTSLSYLKLNGRELQQMAQSGDYTGVAKQLMQGINTNYDTLDANTKTFFKDEMGFDESMLKALGKADTSKFSEQEASINESISSADNKDYLKDFLDNEIMNPIEKFKNWIVNTKVGSIIEEFRESTGLGILELAVLFKGATSILGGFGNLGKKGWNKFKGRKGNDNEAPLGNISSGMSGNASGCCCCCCKCSKGSFDNDGNTSDSLDLDNKKGKKGKGKGSQAGKAGKVGKVGRLVEGTKNLFGKGASKVSGLLGNVGSKAPGFINNIGSKAGGFVSKAGSKVAGFAGKSGIKVAGLGALAAGPALAGGLATEGVFSGVGDLYDATQEKDLDKKKEKTSTGVSKLGMVGAGAAIGSVVPGVGTLIGAGVGGLAAILTGDGVGKWFNDRASDLKGLFQSGTDGWNSMTAFMKNPMSKDEFVETFQPTGEGFNQVVNMSEEEFQQFQMNTMSKWDKKQFEETFKPAKESWSKTIDGMSSMWDSFKGFVSTKWKSLTQGAGTVVQAAADGLGGVKDKVVEGVKTGVTNVVEKGKEIKDKIADTLNSGKETASNVLNKGKEVLDSALEKGKELFGLDGSHKEGLNNVPFDGYRAELHKGEAVLTRSQANMWRENVIDGSHKDGLDSVPFDGYTAELHKNEAVLNAEEAKVWRAGLTGTGLSKFFSETVEKLKPQLRENLANLSKPSSDSPQGVQAADGDFIGIVSAKYEASYPSEDADKISTGKSDHGGKSYGLPQFTSAGGGASANNFVAWLKNSDPQLGGAFGNDRAGTSGFDASWKKAFQINPNAFRSAQQNYAYKTYVEKFVNKAKKEKNLDLNRSRALQELAFSTAIQFGGGGTKALGNVNGSMSDEQIISTSFKAKRDNVNSWFKSSGSSMRSGLKNVRFVKEEGDIKGYLGKPAISAAYEQGTPWVPNTQIALLHEGEMVVPKEHNPLNNSSLPISNGTTASSHEEDGEVKELIDVVRWGISKLERKLDELNNTTSSISSREPQRRGYKSDAVYSF